MLVTILCSTALDGNGGGGLSIKTRCIAVVWLYVGGGGCQSNPVGVPRIHNIAVVWLCVGGGG